MALRSKYNETQTSLHALHDLAQVQLLPWSHQAHGPPFLPSICCPLPGMLFPQASHLHLLHVIAVLAHLSPPQKGLSEPGAQAPPSPSARGHAPNEASPKHIIVSTGQRRE